VHEGGLWYFPAGLPHSLQGIGPDGCEFIICFDNGKASEFNTLLVTDWVAHTPPEDLALNFGVPAETFSKISLHDLYIFQGQVPGPLGADQRQAQGDAGAMPIPSTFQLKCGRSDPADQGRLGKGRRQQQLQGVQDDRSIVRYYSSWRDAGNALAPQC
jgi:oxalate decarboxylase